MFNDKLLIFRLLSFTVPKIKVVRPCNHVKSCTKHGRSDQNETLTVSSGRIPAHNKCPLILLLLLCSTIPVFILPNSLPGYITTRLCYPHHYSLRSYKGNLCYTSNQDNDYRRQCGRGGFFFVNLTIPIRHKIKMWCHFVCKLLMIYQKQSYTLILHLVFISLQNKFMTNNPVE